MINITDKVKCCGCEGCTNICPKNCIEMQSDKEGFLYPQVNTSVCIDCGLCEKVCPILSYKGREKNKKQEAAIVQHKDREICRQSTAGGAFTAIAEYVIEQGGIVFGVEMDKEYTIHHIGVENKEDLEKFRNSKYVQSKVGDTLTQAKKYLDTGRMVCFSGTPCQIEGLRHFLRRNYENLILIDIVCRAVPSPGVWKKYIDMETSQKGKIISIRFRDKSLGYQYSTMEIKNIKNKIYRGGVESQPWLRMFFSGMIIRPSCTDCKFRSRYRNSDFTIWDCFNIYSIDKNFDEEIGTTRILIHSEKGMNIFEGIKAYYNYKKIDADLAIKGVQELAISPKFHERRMEFFNDFKYLDMHVLLKKYFPVTGRIIVKKIGRLFLNRIGLDKAVKHILKKG